MKGMFFCGYDGVGSNSSPPNPFILQHYYFDLNLLHLCNVTSIIMVAIANSSTLLQNEYKCVCFRCNRY